MSGSRTKPVLPKGTARAINAVRRRWLAVRVAEFPLWLLVVIPLAWVAQAAADRWLELSYQTRVGLLVLNGVVVLWLAVVFVLVPLFKRPDRRKAALMIERSDPGFRTALISSVEFAGGAEIPAGSRALVDRLLADTEKLAARDGLAMRVVDAGKLKWRVLFAVVAAGLAVAAYVSALPLSPLLVQRILLSKEGFPAETKVVNVTGNLVVMAGEDAEVSAKAVGVVPVAGTLVVFYPDGRKERIPVNPSRSGGEGVFAYTVKNIREPFGYRFELNDGVGDDGEVTVRVAPALRDVRFTQTYPEYTGLGEVEMSPSALRLLEGSKLKIAASSTVALESAALEIVGEDEGRVLPVTGEGRDEMEIELTVPDRGWRSMSIPLLAANGEVSKDDPVYRVELVRDRPPTLVVTMPKKETITVIPGEKVMFAFRVGDDFGLKRVALCYRVFRPGVDGRPQPAESGELPLRREEDGRSFSRNFEWDLSLMVPQVPVGGTITCWIEAEDNRPDRNLALTRGPEKVIRIVSEEQKRAELLELLGERAKDIERLYDRQREMNQRTDDSIR